MPVDTERQKLMTTIMDITKSQSTITKRDIYEQLKTDPYVTIYGSRSAVDYLTKHGYLKRADVEQKNKKIAAQYELGSRHYDANVIESNAKQTTAQQKADNNVNRFMLSCMAW